MIGIVHQCVPPKAGNRTVDIREATDRAIIYGRTDVKRLKQGSVRCEASPKRLLQVLQVLMREPSDAWGSAMGSKSSELIAQAKADRCLVSLVLLMLCFFFLDFVVLLSSDGQMFCRTRTPWLFWEMLHLRIWVQESTIPTYDTLPTVELALCWGLLCKTWPGYVKSPGTIWLMSDALQKSIWLSPLLVGYLIAGK